MSDKTDKNIPKRVLIVKKMDKKQTAMTPKEKAQEIYCKYADALNIRDLQTTANPFAKQCALIAVDEVVAQIEPSVSMDVISARIEYWQQVKQEIEKL